MYILCSTIFLVLPSFSFATPAQLTNSRDLITTIPSISNPITVQPVDPRFSMQPVYQAEPLDEDQCLVAAIQLMGLYGSDPFTSPKTTAEYWDNHVPRVVIAPRTTRRDGTMETRFLVWGLYLGIKDMIETNRFNNVQFVLRWDSVVIGGISIKSRTPGQLSLTGENSTSSTNILRRSSSSNLSNLLASENLDGTSSNLSVPTTLSTPNTDFRMEIQPLDTPVPKYSVIMTLLDGILAVASRTTRAQVPDPVEAQPAYPYEAKLQVLPSQTMYGQPYLTFGIVSLALRQIPAALLLRTGRWVEVSFRIMLNGVLVAQGSLSLV